MEMQAGHGDFFLRLAEAKFHAALIRLNGVDGLDRQECDDREDNENRRPAVETTRNDPAKTVLAAADQVFQIRRTTTSASATAPRTVRTTAAPWALIIAAAAAPRAAAAILIAPGH